MQPRFFADAAELRAWLERHHADTPELLVGFHKKRSGRPSITWSEAVDEALCVGWIDGVRRRVDDDSYTIRFTPRQARSTWSAVNTRRAQELQRAGRMRAAGLRAFNGRADERSAIYAYEQRQQPTLQPDQERRFRANRRAWEFFNAQPPSYRRTATWWVVSAKRAETRAGRLDTLIRDSADGRRIRPLQRRFDAPGEPPQSRRATS